jgi:hypothetical protein
MKDVDNVIWMGVVPIIMRRLGFSSIHIEAVLKNLTMLWTDVKFVRKDKRLSRRHRNLVLFKGRVFGTVYSGHPSKTTAGNTTRILMLIWACCLKAGIEINKECFPFQAGDDTVLIMEKERVDALKAQLDEFYSDEGYGLVMKDFGVSETRFDFLSRDGFYDHSSESIKLMRKCERVVQSGLYSNKMKPEEMNMFDRGITKQIEAWGAYTTGVKEYCSWRCETDATHVSDKVNKRMEEAYWVLHPEKTPIFLDSHPMVSNDYKILASLNGDPHHLWVKHA